MSPVTAATLRLMAAARPLTGDPVADADHQTTMADLRAAICLADGMPADDIGPLGHDHSAAGYARVRASWVSHIAMFGLSMFEDGPDEVLTMWRGIQPGLAAGDDWRSAGGAAHKERYDGADCGRETCVVCFPLPDEDE